LLQEFQAPALPSGRSVRLEAPLEWSQILKQLGKLLVPVGTQSIRIDARQGRIRGFPFRPFHWCSTPWGLPNPLWAIPVEFVIAHGKENVLSAGQKLCKGADAHRYLDTKVRRCCNA